MKRKGFKTFVLKVCDSKGFADMFLGKCVKRKALGSILASFEVLILSDRSESSISGLSGGPLSKQGGLAGGAWRLQQEYVYHNEIPVVKGRFRQTVGCEGGTAFQGLSVDRNGTDGAAIPRVTERTNSCTPDRSPGRFPFPL